MARIVRASSASLIPKCDCGVARAVAVRAQRLVLNPEVAAAVAADDHRCKASPAPYSLCVVESHIVEIRHLTRGNWRRGGRNRGIGSRWCLKCDAVWNEK